MRAIYLALIAFLALSAAGCPYVPQERLIALRREMIELQQENQQLRERAQQVRSENQALQRRMDRLSEIRPDVAPDQIYQLEQVNLHRYSGFFDDTRDGTVDTLLVYVQPVDDQGDIIKAAGQVTVTLLDLEADQPLRLGRWEISPQQLRRRWFTGLTTSYRLRFDITDVIDAFDRPLTLQVRFTDIMTGRDFTLQRALSPD